MKRIFKLLSVLCAVSCTSLAYGQTEPFDFAYAVEGKCRLVVFNDGEVTYIQKREGTPLQVTGYPVTNRGPYIVLKGTPAVVDGNCGNEMFRLVWNGSKSAAVGNEDQRKNSDLPEKTFAGIYGRIAFLNGEPPEVGIHAPLQRGLELREALKALSPHGWSGTADKSIDITQSVSIQSTKGESWVIVLDRLMQSVGTWVEIDFEKGNLFLRDAPPKGFNVALNSSTQLRKPATISYGKVPIMDDFTPIEKVASTNSVIRSANIRSIEEVNGNIYLSVINTASKIRVFDTETQKEVETRFDENRIAYMLPGLSMFAVSSENGSSIEVKRVVRRIPSINSHNALGLVSVSEDAAGTHFQFKERVQKLQFSSDPKELYGGMWSGNTFTIDAHASNWKITSQHIATYVEFEEKALFMWRSRKDPSTQP